MPFLLQPWSLVAFTTARAHVVPTVRLDPRFPCSICTVVVLDNSLQNIVSFTKRGKHCINILKLQLTFALLPEE